MTVWMVTRAWYDIDRLTDVWETVGIYSTKEKAERAKTKATEYMANAVDEYGEKIEFEDVDVWIDEIEIDKTFIGETA